MAKSKQENSGDLYELARDYARFRAKLARKVAGVEAAEERMKRKIEEYENTLPAAQKGVV